MSEDTKFLLAIASVLLVMGALTGYISRRIGKRARKLSAWDDPDPWASHKPGYRAANCLSTVFAVPAAIGILGGLFFLAWAIGFGTSGKIVGGVIALAIALGILYWVWGLVKDFFALLSGGG